MKRLAIPFHPRQPQSLASSLQSGLEIHGTTAILPSAVSMISNFHLLRSSTSGLGSPTSQMLKEESAECGPKTSGRARSGAMGQLRSP